MHQIRIKLTYVSECVMSGQEEEQSKNDLINVMCVNNQSIVALHVRKFTITFRVAIPSCFYM